MTQKRMVAGGEYVSMARSSVWRKEVGLNSSRKMPIFLTLFAALPDHTKGMTID
jgi:hypothetical protein